VSPIVYTFWHLSRAVVRYCCGPAFFPSWFPVMKIILIFVSFLACLNYDETHFRLAFSVDYTTTKRVNSDSNSIIHHVVGSRRRTLNGI
jgi:hypothetical protein